MIELNLKSPLSTDNAEFSSYLNRPHAKQILQGFALLIGVKEREEDLTPKSWYQKCPIIREQVAVNLIC